MRRTILIGLSALAVLLLGAASAEAVVIDMGASGRYGVALVPGTRGTLATAGIKTAAPASPTCTDPWLAPDFLLPSTGLCYQGGPVIQKNETFVVSWDPHRRDWQTARNYVEQYLRDVADGSRTFTSPYALTGQYHGWRYPDGPPNVIGGAANQSAYGGGCTDFGVRGGSACKFTSAIATGPGHDDAGNDCPVTGTNFFWQDPAGGWGSNANEFCVTDQQIRTEVSTMVGEMGLADPSHTQTGYSTLVVLRLPPGVVACIDATGSLCSANGKSKAQFCSYHAQATVGSHQVAYVVQPWTANTACDDPTLPKFTFPPDVSDNEFATEVGERVVGPLSAGQLAAITDPALNGWYALDASEINDNGCVPLAKPPDTVTVGKNSYALQREFNNGGLLVSEPNAERCADVVELTPRFIVPSPLDAGDVVAFDGSVTDSTLLIPQAGYTWNFGDGTVRQGASVVHSFAKSGVYSVQLTVTDRGGNVATLTQSVTVTGSGGTNPGQNTNAKLQARLALIPQSYQSMLRSGIALRVTSSEPADGFSTILISRSAAKRAHLRTGRSANVVVARGTVSGIKSGTVRLHLRLAPSITAKLARLGHLKLTIRLSLIGKSGAHATIDAAGSY